MNSSYYYVLIHVVEPLQLPIIYGKEYLEPETLWEEWHACNRRTKDLETVWNKRLVKDGSSFEYKNLLLKCKQRMALFSNSIKMYLISFWLCCVSVSALQLTTTTRCLIVKFVFLWMDRHIRNGLTSGTSKTLHDLKTSSC
jgi:hypothetical protein